MRRATTLLAVALLLALPLAHAVPRAAQEADRVRLDSVGLRLVLPDNATRFVAWPAPVATTADAAAARGQPARVLDLTLDALVEFRDLDNDGTPAAHEVVQRLAFSNASWNVTLVETDALAHANLTLRAPPRLATPVEANASPREPAEVTILLALSDEARAVRLQGQRLDLGPADAGLTLVVRAWPALDARHAIALLATAHGAATTTEGVGTQRLLVGQEGQTVGHVAWFTSATDAQDRPVTARAKLDASNATARLTVAYGTSGADGLRHEAALGVPWRPPPAAPEEAAPASLPQAAKATPAPAVLATALAALLATLARRARQAFMAGPA